MASMLPLRGPVNCFRCGTPLVLPEWSEIVDDERVSTSGTGLCAITNLKQLMLLTRTSSAGDELLQKFLHKLVVA